MPSPLPTNTESNKAPKGPTKDKAQGSSPRSTARYYRFGICGGPSSGKTCILTALGMPRIPHPDRLSATLLPPPRLGSSGLKAGTAWIEEQKLRLANGDVPEQNPNIDQRLVLRYKFIDKAKNEHFVELEDYSGELMNARSAAAELAEKLRKRLVEMDGLLIVAQHPRPGAKANEHAPELHSLRGAFAKLREDQLDRSETHVVPMALLVNKWDRTGTLDLSSPSIPVAPQHTHGDRLLLNTHKSTMTVEQAKLLDFLTADQRPPHTTLLDELESASDQHCVAYPVSAFGESRTEIDAATGAKIEKPSNPHELPSFGLEDPFIWLIQQRIELDVERLEKLANTRLLALRPTSVSRCKNEAKRILQRIKTASPDAVRPESVRKRATRLQNIQNLVFACLLFLSVLAGEAVIDATSHRKHRNALDNSADEAGWKTANAWYLDYVAAKAWRHLGYGMVFSRAKADEERLGKLKDEDEKSWASIMEGTKESLSDRKNRAEEHLRLHRDPNNYVCQHADLVLNLKGDWEEDQRRQKASDLLTSFEGRLTSYDAQFQELKKNPRPDYAELLANTRQLDADIQVSQRDIDGLTDKKETGLSARRNEVKAKTLKLIADIAVPDSNNKLRAKYRRAMEELNVAEAGRLLVDEMTTSEFDDLKKDFSVHAANVLEAKVLDEAGGLGQRWETGIARLDSFERDQRIIALNPKEFAEKVRALREKVLLLGDSYLYSKVVNGGATEAQTYLDKAPYKMMDRKGLVTAFRDYLVACNSMQQFRIRVSQINWPQTLAKDNFAGAVIFSVNDVPQSPVNLSAGSGATPWTEAYSSYAASVDISCKATDPVKLALKLRAPTFWYKELGEAKVSRAIESWAADGEAVRLAGGDYPGSLVKLKAQINNGRGGWSDFTKPELPQWNPQH